MEYQILGNGYKKKKLLFLAFCLAEILLEFIMVDVEAEFDEYLQLKRNLEIFFIKEFLILNSEIFSPAENSHKLISRALLVRYIVE